MGTLTTVVSSEDEEVKNSPLTFDDRGYVGNAGQNPHPLIEQLSREGRISVRSLHFLTLVPCCIQAREAC